MNIYINFYVMFLIKIEGYTFPFLLLGLALMLFVLLNYFLMPFNSGVAKF